jgi:hypothetical protein
VASDYEWLDQPVVFDRLSKFFEPLMVKVLPRLTLLWDDLIERAGENVAVSISLARTATRSWLRCRQ